MCFNGPKWKREVIPDHKFDFVDTRDFHSKALGVRMRYLWLYVLVIKSFAVYLSDIFTAVTMLSTNDWSNSIFRSCPQNEKNGCVFIPFDTAKWLFVGCIIFSFLLLGYEARKSKKIIASRDISYAFTNIMANNYYSLRSFDHFCFFCHINDSTKTQDNFAFFIFFTFKDWKRLLLADGPRQAINGLTLYSLYISKRDPNRNFYDITQYTDGSLVTTGLLISTMFTVIIFAGSLALLIAAAILYIPLLCYIRGNLKEYCCHKVDKRISEVVKRKAKQRLQQQAALARKEAAGDFSHYKNKKGQMIKAPLPQPTLPNISLDDEPEPPFWQADQKSDYQSSIYSGRENVSEYPPMPMYGYNQPHNNFNPSAPTLHDPSVYDGASQYEYENLAQSAAPPGRSMPVGQHAIPNPYSPSHGDYAQHEWQQPRYPPSAQPTHGGGRPTSGLAYDTSYDYGDASPYQLQPQTIAQQYGQRRSPDQDARAYDRGYGGYAAGGR